MDTSATEASITNNLVTFTWILAGLGGGYALLRTSNWTRRHGSATIDLSVIPTLAFYACRYMGLMFFVVLFFATFLLAIHYNKRPPWRESGSVAHLLYVYIPIAFGLRCLSLLHRLGEQALAEVFFVDWERPKGVVRVGEMSPSQDNHPPDPAGYQEAPVSIWRCYFLACKWLNLQTRRSVAPILFYPAMYFLLQFTPLLDLARVRHPDASRQELVNGTVVTIEPSLEMHTVNRFVVVTSALVASALVLWALESVVLERFSGDRVQQFVDECSLANVSVLVLTHQRFGYYIHGRSVHGTADVGIRETNDMLIREQVGFG